MNKEINKGNKTWNQQIITAILKPKEGFEEQLLFELKKIQKGSRKEVGCIKYDVHQGVEASIGTANTLMMNGRFYFFPFTFGNRYTNSGSWALIKTYSILGIENTASKVDIQSDLTSRE